MARSVNTKKVWQNICDTIEPAARLALVREAIESLRTELTRREEEEKCSLGELRDLARHPGRGAGVRLQLAGLLLLALVLLAADTPLQFALNAVSMPQIPKWIWAATAPAFAIGLGALVHSAAVAFLYDNTRPARSIRTCRRLTWLTFVLALVAGGVILFARVASAATAPYIVDLASISMWVLAETLPTSAGLALAWAHFLSLPTREDRRLRRTRQRKTELERFLDQLGVEENALSLAEETAQPAATTGAARAGHLATSVVALLLAGAAPAPAQTCGLATDRTISQAPEDRIQAAQRTQATLRELVGAFDCTDLVLVAFTDEGRWAPRLWLKVPQPEPVVDCADVSPPPSNGSKQLLSAFAGFRTHFEREATRACLSRQAADSTRFQSEWNSFAAEVRDVLAQPLVSHETHTDIAGILESLFDEGAETVVVVTDGIDTAHDGVRSLAIPENGRVILVLVPARPEYGGREKTDRARQVWQEIDPRIVAVPYTDLSSPFTWARLGLRSTSGRSVPCQIRRVEATPRGDACLDCTPEPKRLASNDVTCPLR